MALLGRRERRRLMREAEERAMLEHAVAQAGAGPTAAQTAQSDYQDQMGAAQAFQAMAMEAADVGAQNIRRSLKGRNRRMALEGLEARRSDSVDGAAFMMAAAKADRAGAMGGAGAADPMEELSAQIQLDQFDALKSARDEAREAAEADVEVDEGLVSAEHAVRDQIQRYYNPQSKEAKELLKNNPLQDDADWDQFITDTQSDYGGDKYALIQAVEALRRRRRPGYMFEDYEPEDEDDLVWNNPWIDPEG